MFKIWLCFSVSFFEISFLISSPGQMSRRAIAMTPVSSASASASSVDSQVKLLR